MAEPLSVIFVCTANRARSPLAEALYRRYTSDLQTVASSYGTSDVGAAAPLATAVEAGTQLGVDLSVHRARALARGALANSDLVLGFEPFHVAAAIVDGGASPAHTFLLGELVALLSSGTIAHADPRALIELADAMRVRSRPDETGAVLDPVGKGDAVMAAVAAQVDGLVSRLVNQLFSHARGSGARPSSD